jgi:hypothetical protein
MSPEPPPAPERLTPMGGDRIRTRLVGYRIMPDRRVNQTAMEFAEEFLPDGTWVSRRTERRLTVARGTWRIVANQICIDSQEGTTTCRPVWTDARGRIGIRDMGSSLGAILIMSATPLRQGPS